MRPRRTTAGVFVCQGDETPSRPHETLDFIVVGSILVTDYPQLLNGKLLRRMLRKGDSAWQARIEGLVECSCSSRGPSHFSCPESAVGLPWLGTFDSRLHVLFIRSLRGLGSTALTVLPKGEEYDMRKALPVFIAVCLVLSLCTGVFAPVPEARAAGPATVNLLSAGDFVVLAEQAITSVVGSGTHLTGDVGISPNGASSITGFDLVLDSSGAFSTSIPPSMVTGKVYAADYPPSTAKMTMAVNDMYNAYTDAAGRPNPTETERGAGIIGGSTFLPGIYKWSTDVTIPTDITLSGGPNDVWIFQIAGDLTIASKGSIGEGVKVKLEGGAQASNVFWAVTGSNYGATLGTYSTFNGNILSAKQIIMQTGAALNGRALAQTQVVLDGNTGLTPPPADLAITKTVDNATPLLGSNVTYILTVTNNGPSDATGVSVSDVLPAGLTLMTSTPSIGTDAGGVWTIGSLMNGASAALSITATVTQAGAITNTATVTGAQTDSNLTNNTASAIVTGIIL